MNLEHKLIRAKRKHQRLQVALKTWLRGQWYHVFIREFQKDKTPYPYGLEFDKRVEMEMLKTAEGIQLLQALGGMIPKDDE